VKPYVCIIDLEATCWPDPAPGQHGSTAVDPVSEIIEIGAVIAEARNLVEIASFSRVVRPKLNPILSDFCKELTHISQVEVDEADGFVYVMAGFMDWITSVVAAYPQEQVVSLASWGLYDHCQLSQDCDLHSIKCHFSRDEHVNLKDVVAKKIGRKPRGLKRTLALLGLGFDGQQHRALPDARNALAAARAARIMEA